MKYDKDSAFRDPVVRCDSCVQLIRVEELKKLGSCTCGNRKVRAVQTFSDAERDKMVEWGIDPDYIALFEPVTEQ